MTKQITSQALELMTKALGLSGTGEQRTELLDGMVEQVIDITPVVRRSRTLAGTEGIMFGVLRNVHTDAESLVTTIDPYRVGATAAVAPYPPVVPDSLEVWILGATVARASGGGTLSALLDIQMRPQAFGIDDSGVAVVTGPAQPLAHWDTIVTEGFPFGILAGSDQPFAKIGLRVPRLTTGAGNGPLLTFRTTSSLTMTIQCVIAIAFTPIALGQDAVVF